MVMGELAQETELLVIGSGPGGYAAAFRAADLGLDVTLVDINSRPGGVCLHRGCIPSKTLLHLTELLRDARNAGGMGITFNAPRIDLDGVRQWKQSVVDRLADGLVNLAKGRNVQMLNGRAVFESNRRVRISGDETSHVTFQHAILATGSKPIALPRTDFIQGGRLFNSTGALALPDIPGSLLVVGGGYVGLELGMVYAELGSQVSLVELGDLLLPGVDRDLVRPLERVLKRGFASMHLKTRVRELAENDHGMRVLLEGEAGIESQHFERVLVAIGRQPNSNGLGLENTAVELDPHGFVKVDASQRTTDERIFAIGDVVGGMMLAHKASREGKVAAEVIAGEASAFDVRAIPAVVYTDPQIAWCGLSESEARAAGRDIEVLRFPWSASGRAVSMDAAKGLTKIIADTSSGRILGMGITGRGAEDLIAEGVLAVEMGALVEDMALTIHPHPSLSETEGEAAEIFLGGATHLLPKKR